MQRGGGGGGRGRGQEMVLQPFVLSLYFRGDTSGDFRVHACLHNVVLRLRMPHQEHFHPRSPTGGKNTGARNARL